MRAAPPLSSFAAKLITGQPERLEHRQDDGGFVEEFGTGALGRRGAQRTVQQPQGGLAMITAGGAKLIEEARLVRTTDTAVAAVDAGQGLAFGG
jgi:hypothetical protein